MVGQRSVVVVAFRRGCGAHGRRFDRCCWRGLGVGHDGVLGSIRSGVVAERVVDLRFLRRLCHLTCDRWSVGRRQGCRKEEQMRVIS